MLLIVPSEHMTQREFWTSDVLCDAAEMAIEMGNTHCSSDGYRVISNFGLKAHQSQSHAHLHVISGESKSLENGNQKLLSEKDFVAKIIAAKNSKTNENFMIIARVEALIAGLGVSEATKRADAYEKAGADAILIHSKKNTPDEIFEFCDTWNGNIPIIAIPTSYPDVTLEELQNHKVKMVIYANQSLRAAHWAMAEHLNKLSTSKSLSDVETKMTGMEDIFQLQEMYEIKKQETDIEKNLKKLGYIN